MRTLNVELLVADGRVNYNGCGELEIIGRTVNDVSHKVVITLPPSALSYLAQRLHKIVDLHQQNVNRMIEAMRGENK